MGDWRPPLDARISAKGMVSACQSCVDAPRMQAASRRAQGMWSGAVVCPASSCGNSHAAGPYGDTRTGSKSALRARGAAIDSGFPDPVSLTVCPYPLDRPATSSTTRCGQRIMRQPCRELDRPRPSSSAPRRSWQCGSPGRPRRPGGVSLPACGRARNPPVLLCAMPIAPRSSHR